MIETLVPASACAEMFSDARRRDLGQPVPSGPSTNARWGQAERGVCGDGRNVLKELT